MPPALGEARSDGMRPPVRLRLPRQRVPVRMIGYTMSKTTSLCWSDSYYRNKRRTCQRKSSQIRSRANAENGEWNNRSWAQPTTNARSAAVRLANRIRSTPLSIPMTRYCAGPSKSPATGAVEAFAAAAVEVAATAAPLAAPPPTCCVIADRAGSSTASASAGALASAAAAVPSALPEVDTRGTAAPAEDDPRSALAALLAAVACSDAEAAARPAAGGLATSLGRLTIAGSPDAAAFSCPQAEAATASKSVQMRTPPTRVARCPMSAQRFAQLE